mmetsp:Transcript_104019/g.232266  ORF Transcript_104019/g.232266 Transcript_104019/m.232266 type:complete len:221 (+) Transcript_104019:1-663(+)
MITSSWTLLSILTAVVSDNMISTTEKQEEELRMSNAEEERQEQLDTLRKLFGAIDTNSDGTIDSPELAQYLTDAKRAAECATACKIPARDIVSVLKDLSDDNQPVKMQYFLEKLIEVGNPVTEKSVMKIEARLNGMERKHEKAMNQIREMVLSLEKKQEAWQNRQDMLLRRVLDDGSLSPRDGRNGGGKQQPAPKGRSWLPGRSVPKCVCAQADDKNGPP